MNNKKAYAEVLLDGSSVECGGLSLCLLNDFYPSLKKTRYQVDCSDYKKRFSKLYSPKELGDAINKYLEIKRGLSQ